jgi:hypothetical protein
MHDILAGKDLNFITILIADYCVDHDFEGLVSPTGCIHDHPSRRDLLSRLKYHAHRCAIASFSNLSAVALFTIYSLCM